MVDKETKTLSINFDDELVKATLLTHNGAVVHPNFAGAVPAATAKPSPTDPEVAKAAKGTEPGLEVAPKKASARRKAADKPAEAKKPRAARKPAMPKTGGDA